MVCLWWADVVAQRHTVFARFAVMSVPRMSVTGSDMFFADSMLQSVDTRDHMP